MFIKNIIASLMILALLTIGGNAMAQTATIRGFVYEKANGEPIPSANIVLKGTKISVVTDVNGYFSISGLEPKTYKIVITVLSFDTAKQTVTLKPGEIYNKKFFLVDAATMLGQIDVSVEEQNKTNEVNISVIPVTVDDIKRVPSIGEPDFAQYLQIVPGVTFTGDQGGQLYIRGGTPIQNKVLLDGMIIYNPFHSIGLFSVFDYDIIRSAEVYTGGFNAEYGGRISSVMDITTRDGNKKKLSGKVSASTFGGKLLLEGPLKKLTTTVSGEAEDAAREEIERTDGEINAIQAGIQLCDSSMKKFTTEKIKITENLKKYSVDSNFASLATVFNEQLKDIQKKIDSVTVSKTNLSAQQTVKRETLKKLKEDVKNQSKNDGGSISYLLSAKTSYLDKSSKLIYPYIDKNGLPYSFLDLYGKTSFNSASGSKLNLYGFNFTDEVNYRFVSNLQWKSFGIGSNFLIVPSSSALLVEGSFAYSDYGITLTEADSNPRSSDIKGFNMGLDFSYFRGNNEIKYGIEVLGFRTNFEFYNAVHRKIAQVENTTELGGYFKSKIIGKNKKLILEPSLRLHYYASLRNFSPEPRLGAKWIVTSKFRLKFAGGMYSQNLLSATSDRDVVNLFYGFLSGPDNLQDEFVGENGNLQQIKHKLQKANHAIFGFEYDIMKHLDLNVEGYIKDFTQLTNINRNKLFDDDEDHVDVPDQLKKDFIIETGVAKGIDLLIKYDYKRLYIWAVYSLGFVTRYDGLETYAPHFDRRHNVNLVGSYTFGKDLDWDIDVRWNLGSGFPFTKTAGFYEYLNFSDGINTNYTQTNYDPSSNNSSSTLGILYGEYNAGRLPYYHRLDITVKKRFSFSESSNLEISVGVANVYNRKNIFYFDRVRYVRVNQLPILPSITMAWDF